ncbi:MAG: hypothetical protein AB7E80_11540 [Hyphomicrobiaceae bacterium]
MLNILVVCENNAALSIMAESMINAASKGRWHAFSAGSRPAREFDRHALQAMKELELPLPQVSRPVHWSNFAGPSALSFDVVATLSEAIDWQRMPEWRGAPKLMHWTLPDPLAVPVPFGERLAVLRFVRDLVAEKVKVLLDENRFAAPSVLANDNGADASRRRAG